MAGPTTDHQEILQWARTHDAVPAEIHPRKFDGEPAVLSFLFGKAVKQTDGLQAITWEQFFALFDLLGLSLVYYGGREFELLRIEAKPVQRFEGKPM